MATAVDPTVPEYYETVTMPHGKYRGKTFVEICSTTLGQKHIRSIYDVPTKTGTPLTPRLRSAIGLFLRSREK